MNYRKNFQHIYKYFFQLAPVGVAVQFSEMKILQGQKAILNCRARGIPAPTIKWASGDDGAFPLPPNPRFKMTSGNSLVIESTNISDSGTYYCIASNIMESQSRCVAMLGYILVPGAIVLLLQN